MRCLDCALADQDSPAIGTCTHCGAGVCADHAILGQWRLTVTVPLVRRVAVDPAARLLRCRPCAAAYDARTVYGTAESWTARDQ